MEIKITKISDARHSVEVRRKDSSSDRIELDSRSFLRHDFAHFAVESEIPLLQGYWGSVAGGASLGGDIDSPEIWLAESLAGPVQTLIREEASVSAYLEVLTTHIQNRASRDLAVRVFQRARQLTGHWRATPYGKAMKIRWER